MKNKLRPIYVEWVDATTKSGWHDPEGCGLLDIVTLGWLMWEDDERITICCTRDVEYGDMISSNTIPKAWIKKRKWVKL